MMGTQPIEEDIEDRVEQMVDQMGFLWIKECGEMLKAEQSDFRCIPLNEEVNMDILKIEALTDHSFHQMSVIFTIWLQSTYWFTMH